MGNIAASRGAVVFGANIAAIAVFAAAVAAVSPARASRRDVAQQIYRDARLHYDNGRLAQAAKGFAAIVTRHIAHRVAPYAADLLLDTLARLKRHGELERWVDRMLRMQSIATAERLRRLRLIKVGFLRRRAEALARSRRFASCAKAYLAIYRGPFGRYARRPAELLFNRAVCLAQAGTRGHRSKAAAAYSSVGRLYPKQHIAAVALLRSVELYMAVGRHADARKVFRLMRKLYGRSRARRRLLQRAARMLVR